MKKKDVTKTELKKAAKELNEQLGLEPPILLDIKVEALKKKVIEAADLVDPEQDEFTDGVWDILEALECATRPGSGEEADVMVEGEEADDAVEEAMDDTLVEDFKAAKKLVELKTLAYEWDCFANLDLNKYKGLSGPRELRADMLECLPGDVREQVEPKAAEKPAQGKKDKPAKAQKASTVSKESNTAITAFWNENYGKPEDKGIKVAKEIQEKTGEDLDAIYRIIAERAKQATKKES